MNSYKFHAEDFCPQLIKSHCPRRSLISEVFRKIGTVNLENEGIIGTAFRTQIVNLEAKMSLPKLTLEMVA